MAGMGVEGGTALCKADHRGAPCNNALPLLDAGENLGAAAVSGAKSHHAFLKRFRIQLYEDKIVAHLLDNALVGDGQRLAVGTGGDVERDEAAAEEVALITHTEGDRHHGAVEVGRPGIRHQAAVQLGEGIYVVVARDDEVHIGDAAELAVVTGLHLGTNKQVAILRHRHHGAASLDIAAIGYIDTLDVAADGGADHGPFLREVAFEVVVDGLGRFVVCLGMLELRLDTILSSANCRLRSYSALAAE